MDKNKNSDNKKLNNIKYKYHKNGNTKTIIKYKDGKKHTVSEYHENGKLNSITEYKHDNIHYKCIYHNNQAPKIVINYKNGVKDDETEYNDNGIPIINIQYKNGIIHTKKELNYYIELKSHTDYLDGKKFSKLNITKMENINPLYNIMMALQ